MSELNKIQPAQRIIPPQQDQRVKREKKRDENEKRESGTKQDEDRQQQPEGKVDEYI